MVGEELVVAGGETNKELMENGVWDWLEFQLMVERSSDEVRERLRD